MNTNGHESVGRSSRRAPHYRSRPRTFGWDSGNCFGEAAPLAALGTGFTNDGTRVSPEPPEAIEYNRLPNPCHPRNPWFIQSDSFVFIRVDSWLLKLVE